ncbi:cryptochrome/photolyase family protein [Methylomarinum vadi]|uniref:cryptochrome/photolyase family protein n=1 Tax=Methylomarinum vadi TaxID=438855 RepID=UPI0004DF40E3|nr:deoxyribodipyrimidine photo-lyase [Methylomarinum vadi]
MSCSTVSERPIICWFRNDLRLSDHAALHAAVASGRPLMALYILDDSNAGRWRQGSASRWWLHHSLMSLQRSLAKLGGDLCLRRGNPLTIIPELLAETGAKALYFTRAYEPWAGTVEKALHSRLHKEIDIQRFPGALLFEPEQIKTKAGDPFKVFTPFWKACLQARQADSCLPAPESINFYSHAPYSEDLPSWRLLPTSPDWAGGLREAWQPGEEGAWGTLENFLQTSLTHYAAQRDRPDLRATSCLSPYLHFGELSPRQLWLAIRGWQDTHAGATKGAESFLRELGWREFCWHLLFHWPKLPEEPFQQQFAAFPWQRDAALLQAWQQGRTGYPIVDAGMRELWQTGWMHNRVRMIAASFLVKDLLQPWQDGEAWFWDTLVDADLANNAGGWQWVAGCGADAAPYFRIFNPVLQGKKFDLEGVYVKRWLPELSALPAKHIHEPWLAPNAVLRQAGITLARDYPFPLVDHAEARQRALASFQQSKHSAE